MSNTLVAPLNVKLMNLTASALFLVFAVLALYALAGWAARAPVFAIKSITVTGHVTHTNALTLRANVASKLNGTFLTLDLEQVRQVFESVPWVRHAVVRRVFPDRIKVVLEEHQVVALWGAEGEYRLLNSFGEVFEANTGEVEQDDLPRLIGPDGQGTTVLAAYRAVQPLFEHLNLAVEQFEQTGSGGWRALLDTGAVVELGRGSVDEVVARAQRFLGTLTQVTSKYGRKPDALASADLRHTDGYALKLHGVTTQLPDVKLK